MSTIFLQRWMLVINLVLLVWLSTSLADGQTFTRVITGDIVTNPTFSWGCAFGDFNNDGRLDLFVGNNGVNALYMGNRDSTFIKITTGPVGTDGGNSRGGSWGDYDNDGSLDLFVPNNGTDNFLYHNNGADSGFSFTPLFVSFNQISIQKEV